MRHWRVMTWVLWAWTILCVLWVATGLGAKGSCNGLSQSACAAAGDVGHGIAVFVQIVVWLIVFLILSLIWFMTRPKRHCPSCGRAVKVGIMKCQGCGYEFGHSNVPGPGAG